MANKFDSTDAKDFVSNMQKIVSENSRNLLRLNGMRCVSVDMYMTL